MLMRQMLGERVCLFVCVCVRDEKESIMCFLLAEHDTGKRPTRLMYNRVNTLTHIHILQSQNYIRRLAFFPKMGTETYDSSFCNQT